MCYSLSGEVHLHQQNKINVPQAQLQQGSWLPSVPIKFTSTASLLALPWAHFLTLSVMFHLLRCHLNSPVGEQFLPFALLTQSTQVKAVHKEAFLEIILMFLAVLGTFWTQKEEHFI